MDIKTVLGEELYMQVAEKLGSHKVAIITDGNYIPKMKFDELNEETKGLRAQLDERNTQLAQLKDSVKDSEELTERLKQLETENKASAEEHAAALNRMKLEFAVDMALTAAQARDPRTVRPLLDMDLVRLGDDGKVMGIEEQIKTLQEQSGFLFAGDETLNGGQLIGQRSADVGVSGAGKNPFDPKAPNLTEQGRIYRDDPAKAKALMEQAQANLGR